MKTKSSGPPRPFSKGRQPDSLALSEIQGLLAGAPRDAGLLIEFLHLIQDAYRQISAAHIAALAHELRLSQAEVFEVATFYHHFDVVKEPGAGAPPLTVRVCSGLSCQMAGSATLVASLQASQTAAIRVIDSPCIGRCDCAPAVCVGQNAFGGADAAQVLAAVAANQSQAQILSVADVGTAVTQGTYRILGLCLTGQIKAADTFSLLDEAGLRGLGGAGFPAGRKWRIVASQPGPRLMAVNIDEGEPGTFKDRVMLERNPHDFLEGMLIAAWAVDVTDIYIYLRDEYHAIRSMLTLQLANLTGQFAAAFAQAGRRMPAIHLRRGAGAYICGEESAMIESIEGKRGMPRQRPPYVAQLGLFGRPTLVHNAETLSWVAPLLDQGAAALAGQGRHGRKGLRNFSVSGRVARPGVYLTPAGITLQELIDEFCGGMLAGHTLYAYLPGGASGGLLPARLANLPLDFDTLQAQGCFIGSAAIVVLSQHDRARDAALNALEFFKHESCGQCTPCRAGTEKAVHLLRQDRWDAKLLADLGQTMQDASICGLGQAAPNPFLCVLKYFPDEVAG